MNTVPQKKGFWNKVGNLRRGVGRGLSYGAQRVSNAAGYTRNAAGKGLMAAGRGISAAAVSARNAASRGLGLARQNANTASKLAGISAQLNTVLSRLNKINVSLEQGAINRAVRANVNASKAVTTASLNPTPNNARKATLAVQNAGAETNQIQKMVANRTVGR